MKLSVGRSEQEWLGGLVFICFYERTSFAPVHTLPCNKISSPKSSGSKLDLETVETVVLKALANQSRTGTNSRRKTRLHCPTVFWSFNQLTYAFSLQKRATALLQSLFKAGSLYQESSCRLDDRVRLSWQVVIWLCAHSGALTYIYSTQLLRYRGCFFYASLYINSICSSACHGLFFFFLPLPDA